MAGVKGLRFAIIEDLDASELRSADGGEEFTARPQKELGPSRGNYKAA